MNNSNVSKDCCEPKSPKLEKTGLLAGILYGILPHTFCIAFIVFSIIGATTASLFFKKMLLIPYLFNLLIGMSVVFATISAVIYLKRNNLLSLAGMKKKWRYLLVLYGLTITVNWLFFNFIFPVTANFNQSRQGVVSNIETSSMTIKVAIPCPGHAPLISDELKKVKGVLSVRFNTPDLFNINYDSTEATVDQIIALDVFNTYKASIVANW